jgi:hypothetical protein
VIIHVDGPSGAGKTTFVERLLAPLCSAERLSIRRRPHPGCRATACLQRPYHPERAENTAASSVRNYPVARYEGAPVNDDLSERLLDAISRLEEVADAVTPHDAHQQLDETSMQVFWKRWPGLSSWAGSLWRLLNEELAEPAVSPKDSDLDEVGGSG